MKEASRTMRYARALGWGVLAAAPILLGALALVSARPDAPPSVVTGAGTASCVAGGLALVASLLESAGRRRGARAAGVVAASVVATSLALLVLAASDLEPRVAALDERERAELVRAELGGEPSLVHPYLEVSVPAPADMERAPRVERELERAGGPGWARAHRAWAWRAGETEIVLDVSRAPSASAAALAEAVEAVARELEASGRRVERSSGERSAVLEARLEGGGVALSRVAMLEHGGRAYRLVATVTTHDAARWREWLDAIRAPAP